MTDQINVGDLKRELDGLPDNCVISFGYEGGELFFTQIKSKNKDNTIISFEFTDPEHGRVPDRILPEKLI